MSKANMYAQKEFFVAVLASGESRDTQAFFPPEDILEKCQKCFDEEGDQDICDELYEDLYDELTEEEEDGCWRDFDSKDVYLGMIAAESADEARREAAASYGFHPAQIEVYSIDDWMSYEYNR